MKNIKIIAAAALTLISCASFAETVTVTASTLDSAEAKISAQAKDQGASYKILSAIGQNKVHMTAEISK
jgi:hypothetical protein